MTTKILIVCLGNICRSPTAHAILRSLALERRGILSVDSAGTSEAHLGEIPDLRAREVALNAGYDMSDIRARKIRKSDFSTFDLILAMDQNILFKLQTTAPSNATSEIKGFLAAAGTPGDVPDPYYAGNFGQVLRQIETASHAILERVRIN